MNKIHLAAIAAVLFLIITSAGCIFQETYYVGIDDDGTEPFIIRNAETGELSGLDIESIKWIAEHENINIEFVSVEWENALPSLIAGKIDLICSDLSVTDERKEMIAFSMPYMINNLTIAANKKYNTTMDDFYNGKVTMGVPLGTTSQDYLENYFGENSSRMEGEGVIVTYNYVDDMFSALEKGEIKTAVFEENAVENYIKKFGNIYILGETGVSEYIAIGLRKENTALIDKINHGLTDLTASEKWPELKKKYGFE